MNPLVEEINNMLKFIKVDRQMKSEPKSQGIDSVGAVAEEMDRE